MHKILALGVVALSLALGVPAQAQMEHRETMRVDTPAGATVTRTVDRADGSRTVVRRTEQPAERTVVRHTVVRTERNTGWHRHHRQCVTRWHHHRRVTRCWTR